MPSISIPIATPDGPLNVYARSESKAIGATVAVIHRLRANIAWVPCWVHCADPALARRIDSQSASVQSGHGPG